MRISAPLGGLIALSIAFGASTACAHKPPRPTHAGQLTKPAKPLTKKQKQLARDMKYASFLLLIEKDYAAAADQYAKIVRKNRKYVDAHMGLVSAYKKLGEHEKVADALNKLVKVAPKDVAARVALGEAMARIGKADEAAAAYHKALELDPNHPLALKAAGDIAYREYSQKQTAENKQRVLSLYERYLQRTTQRRGREGARIHRVVVELRDGAAAAAFLDGEKLYAKAFSSRRGIARSLERAYQKFEAVLKADPKHRGALYYQGLIHLSVKSKSLHDLQKGVERLKAAGDHAPALTELGRLARTDDALEQATTFLTRAITLDPKFQKAHYELGLVHKLADRRDEAIAAFDAAIDADSNTNIAAKAVVELSILAPQNMRVKGAFRTAGGFKGDIFNTEKFKGSILQLEARLGGVDTMAPEQAWLADMMHRLIDAADADGKHVFTVKVVKTTKINAFAVPNGNIYFTRGFLDLVHKTFPDLPMDAENPAIASVMGHEITHVLKEHVIRSFVFRDAMHGNGFTPSTLVSVTRTHEIEADREGMKMMFLAGYDPTWAVRMFEAYAARLGEVPSGLDHPTFDERIHYLEEYWSNEMSFAYASFHTAVRRMEEAGKLEHTDLDAAAALYREAIEDLKRFAVAFEHTREALNNLGAAYAKLGVFELVKANPKSPMTRWFSEFSVEPELALKFVPLTKRRSATRGTEQAADAQPRLPASLRRARTFLKKALKKSPRYARAQLNLGVVYLASGQYDDAEKALAALADQCGQDSGCGVDTGRVENLIGIAKAERGQMAEAVAHFQKSVDAMEPSKKAPPRVFNLALALEEAGEKDKAVETYRRFLAETGDMPSGFATRAREAVDRLD